MESTASSTQVYTCKTCKYKTERKNSWKRHLKSKKHNNFINPKNKLICAVCNITLGSRTTLWRHSKVCNKQLSMEEVLKENTKLKNQIKEKDNMIKELESGKLKYNPIIVQKLNKLIQN